MTQLLILLAWIQPEAMEAAQREARQLNHLIAAYSVVWIILAVFILILMLRNRKLLNQIDELELRLKALED